MSYRTALFRSKGIPEWYIDIYKTRYVRHLGRHLKVLEGWAAGVDGEIHDRHSKFAIYGGFQQHDTFMLGPLPDRQLCIENYLDTYSLTTLAAFIGRIHMHWSMQENALSGPT